MTNHLTNNQLNSYLHQTLTDAEREALGRHLADCPACRAQLNGHEALQRQIHYELANDLRHVQPSPQMSFAAIAPRLKHTRRFTMVLKQSNQFIYGAVTMALLVAAGVGLYFFLSNLSRPTPTTPEEMQQPTAAPTAVNQPTIAPTAAIKPPTVKPTLPATTPKAVISQPTVNPTPEVSQPVVSSTEEIAQPSASPVKLVLSIKGDPNPLSFPSSVAVDLQSNLYVLDGLNNRIQKFDRNGQFLTMWGAQGTSDGQFNFIMPGFGGFGAVAVDGQGQVYVVDIVNRRIQKFDGNGQFLAKWDSRGQGDGQFLHPADVAMDGQGYVYILDDQRNDIQKFDSNGQFLAKWGSVGSDKGQFNQPWGLAVDGEGNVYVADNGNHRVQKFDAKGQFLAQWGTAGTGDGQFLNLNDLAVDEQDNIYVADVNGSSIQKFDSNGQFLTRWGGFGSGDNQFNQPTGVAVDGEGNVYVADDGNNRVQKFRQP